MPYKAGRGCAHPGCPAIVTDGPYCAEHRPLNADERPSPSRRGYDKRWQKIRAMHLAREPLCRECRKRGLVVPATEVDHILPLSHGGSHASDNLQSLCKSCHSKKTRGQGGIGDQISGAAGQGTVGGGSRTRPQVLPMGVEDGS